MTAATATWLTGICLLIGTLAYVLGGAVCAVPVVGFTLLGFGLWLDLTED